ncbi:hypothetical protein LCGC14_1353030 [marine sediment metagenome]|uniref:Uncharacterized protein n=1 Tax=marine sediment metagenome TaxID=412755 RepID=A0A0F9KAA1_9ZZZZ
MTKSYCMAIKPPVDLMSTRVFFDTATLLLRRHPVGIMLQFWPLLNQTGLPSRSPLIFRNVIR